MKIKYVDEAEGKPTDGYVRGFGYPDIDRLLQTTRGFLPYQENLMSVYGQVVYADVATSQSELLQYADFARNVIAKKKEKELPKLREQWVDGCLKSGIDDETMELLWLEFEASSNYSFNIAHAGMYSMYSGQLAWFRWNFPVQFAAQRMNIKPKERNIWIRYCALKDYEIRPPRANLSTTEWNVKDNIIYAPIGVINRIGKKADKIMAKQPFSSVKDFEDRVESSECDKSNKLALWMMGYFDDVKGDFDDLKTEFEIVKEDGVIRIYKWKSEPQKRNHGKIKRRAVKDENGKKIGMEEYVYEGKKDLVYELTNTWDFFYHFQSKAVFYTPRYTDICQRLVEAGFEISIVDKVKTAEEYGQLVYELYCDGDDKKPLLKIKDWMVNKYPDVFVPEEQSHIAYMKHDKYRHAVKFTEEEQRSFEKNGETIKWWYRKGFQMRDITQYLKEDII